MPTTADARRRRGFDLGDLLLLAVPLLCLFPLRSNDLWWHLASGRAMVEQRAFLHGDPFSFTGFMGNWVDNAWLSQLVYYGTWRLGGNLALVVLRAATYTAIFVALRGLLRAGRQPSALFPCLAAALLLSYGWWELRPSAFSMLLAISVLWILEHARRTGRRLALLPAIFLIWASVHPGFLFGLCVLAGTVVALFVEPFVPGWTRWSSVAGLAPKLAGWATLSAAATLVNPYGWRVYEEQISITRNTAFRAVLDEWVPPAPSFVIPALLAAAAFALWRGRRVPLAGWAALLGALALSTTGVRFQEYFALVAVPLAFIHAGPLRPPRGRAIAAGLLLGGALIVGWRTPLSTAVREGRPGEAVVEPAERRLERRMHINAALVAAIAAAGAIAAARKPRDRARWLLRAGRSRSGAATILTAWALAGVVAWRAASAGWLPSDYVEPDRYPGACLGVIAGESLRAFNRLSWGGWLLWKARIPTFIDGRGWGQPLFADYMTCQGPQWRTVFDAHRIDAAIVAKGDTIAEALRNDPGWQSLCDDDVSMIFRKRGTP